MKLKFFVNVYDDYDDYDDKTREAIEAYYGLDKLFSQEELDEFIKTLPERLKQYVIEKKAGVYKVESKETVVSVLKKEVTIEQISTILFSEDSKQEIRQTFFVSLDYDSLYDSLCESLCNSIQP